MRRQTNSRKILIVDDELSVRDSLREWFIEDGFSVETAERGSAYMGCKGSIASFTLQAFACSKVASMPP